MKKYIPILITMPFFVFLIRLINNDFWYDEYYMLFHKAFNPLKDITTNYNSVNTHQLMAVWCKFLSVIGGFNITTALDSPDIMRVPQLVLPIVTIIYLWKICKKYFNRKIGYLSIAILLTTIPYYYYALQIRGYSLSVMLMTMILYYSWGDMSGKKPLLLIGLTALFCYTMSSNFFFVVILIGYLAITKESNFKILSVGCALGVVMYTPLLMGMMGDPFVSQQGMFTHSVETMTGTLWEVINGFMSYRWFLPVLALIGYFRGNAIDRKIMLCIIMLTVPFLLFALHGGKIYGRFMFPALPCFCIFLAVGIENIKGIKQ